MGFKDQLEAIKKQAAEKAAEKAKTERAKTLPAEYEMLEASLSEAEKEGAGAQETIKEIEDMGELDPETTEQIANLKSNAEMAIDKITNLRSELERVKAELSGAESAEPVVEPAKAEAPAETVPAEIAPETLKEETAEVVPAESQEATPAEAAVEEKVEAPAEIAPETATVEAPAEKSEAEAIEAVRKDDEAVETFIRLRGWKGRMNKSETEQMEYVKNHPEKISEYTDRIKENIPTLDEKKDEILFSNAADLAKKDENFRQTIIKRLIDRGIIKSEEDGVSAKEASPVLREMEKEIISTPRKDSAGRMRTEEEIYPLQLAGQHYEKLQSYFYQHEGNLIKLGKEGEGALISVIDNYLDAVENYLDYPEMVLDEDIKRGLGRSRPLSSSITQSFDIIERNLKDISNPETKQAILQRVVKLSEKAKKIAKSTEDSHYVQEHYDSIIKKISKEK